MNNLERVIRLLKGIPHMSSQSGTALYNHIFEMKPKQCLELGFAHGVSSCYIATALKDIGEGHLTSVDIDTSRYRIPPIEELLNLTDVKPFVTVVREKTSYNWFLKKEIERNTNHGVCIPYYDFCFIDGPKNWTIDGLAFFLVDKLLLAGGWIVFDDYSWTYSQHFARTGTRVTDGINHQELSTEELEIPHIEAVFRNLVMQHPSYGNFKVIDRRYAFAQKLIGMEK